MQHKPEVLFKDINAAIYYAIGIAEEVYKRNGATLVVTSANDGEHMKGSFHYVGCAVDIRTRDLPVALRTIVYEQLNDRLNPLGFDVIFEGEPPHIHIEYDPKAGENWQKTVQ